MALKGIEHYKANKGPPFYIKHQLMLSDLILIVKISLKSAISFSFIFLLFLPNLVRIGINYENYLYFPYANLFI